jgi:hypothetical protein
LVWEGGVVLAHVARGSRSPAATTGGHQLTHDRGDQGGDQFIIGPVKVRVRQGRTR